MRDSESCTYMFSATSSTRPWPVLSKLHSICPCQYKCNHKLNFSSSFKADVYKRWNRLKLLSVSTPTIKLRFYVPFKVWTLNTLHIYFTGNKSLATFLYNAGSREPALIVFIFYSEVCANLWGARDVDSRCP